MKLALLGDTHANGADTYLKVKRAEADGVDAIFQLGDFAYAGDHRRTFIAKLQGWLTDAGLDLFWIDGNHDCLSQDTRCLTRRGLKFYSELLPWDEVLSVEDDGTCVWLPIEKAYVREHNGPMIHVQTRHVDTLVTPEHRMVGTSLTKGDWIEYKASDLLTKRCYIRLFSSGHFTAPDYPIADDMLRLMAWCITDGTCHIPPQRGRGIRKRKHPRARWTIYQRESNHQKVVNVLDRLELDYSIYIRARKITQIAGKLLKKRPEREVAIALPASVSEPLPWGKTRLPSWTENLSSRQVAVFLDTLFEGDGSWATSDNSRSGALYINQTNLHEDIQCLLARHGYRTFVSSFRNGSDSRLNICPKDSFQLVTNTPTSKSIVEEVDYSGAVWCLKVRTGRFFVERNSRIYLTGNCHEAVMNRQPNNAGFVEVRNNILYAPRGHRWTWDGVNFMSVGGAFSIDKDFRLQYGHFWSPFETITYAEMLHASREGNVDVMLTHDAPLGVDCMGPKTAGGDKNQWPESYTNRQMLSAIVEAVKPDQLYHGHYHYSYTQKLELDDGHMVEVTGLARDTMANSYLVLEF